MEIIQIQDHVRKVKNDLNLPQPLGHNIEALINAFSNVHIKTRPSEEDYLPRIKKQNDNYIIFIPEQYKNIDTSEAVFFVTTQFGHILLGHVDRHLEQYNRSANRLVYDAEIWAMNILIPFNHYREQVNKHVDEENRVNIRKVAKYFNVTMNIATNYGKLNGILSLY